MSRETRRREARIRAAARGAAKERRERQRAQTADAHGRSPMRPRHWTLWSYRIALLTVGVVTASLCAAWALGHR